MSTKVTVTVETGKPSATGGFGRDGSRETFTVEWEGTPERALIAAHVEHHIAELGAEMVAKVAAVYGDARVGTPFTVHHTLRTFPLGDYLRQLKETRKGVLGANFAGFNAADPEIGRKVQAALSEMRANLESIAQRFADQVERSQKKPVKAATDGNGQAEAEDDKPL